MIELIGAMLREEQRPPVFQSANVDGGGTYNEILLEAYKDRIFYV